MQSSATRDLALALFLVSPATHRMTFALPFRRADAQMGLTRVRGRIKKLAHVLCNETYPFCCILDDNVEVWKGVKVTTVKCGVGPNDYMPDAAEEARCAELFKNYQIERYKTTGNLGKHYDISLGFVLKQMHLFLTEHLNTPEARNKIGVIGFNRIGRSFQATRNAFTRACVYKAVILNLEALSEVHYKERVWAMEDIDFDLRVNGCKAEAPIDEHGKPTGFRWKIVDDPKLNLTKKVTCKFYRFAFKDRKLSGGTSHAVARGGASNGGGGGGGGGGGLATGSRITSDAAQVLALMFGCTAESLEGRSIRLSDLLERQE